MRKIILTTTLILFAYFLYEIIFGGNPFKNVQNDKLQDSLRSLSFFLSYLFLALIPFNLYPKAFKSWLIFLFVSFPIIAYIHFDWTIDSFAYLKPDSYDLAIFISLLYVPTSLFFIYRTHRKGKLTNDTDIV